MIQTLDLKLYFPELTSIQIERFNAMGELYEDWNSKINVVSRKDIDQIYTHHILHSLAIAQLIRFKPGTTVLDVGCGGGFPGIPLAVMFPESEFTLCDSIGKKITVVNSVAESLGLTNLKGIQQRADQIPRKFDFVVSRAVTQMPEFVNWVWNKITPRGFNALPNGILYLKGGDLTEELKATGKKCTTYDISEYFSDEYFETKKIVYIQR